MSSFGATRLIAACIMAIALGSAEARAGLVFTLNTDQANATSPLSVKVEVDQFSNDLKFKLTIIDGPSTGTCTGDLRGFFFHIKADIPSGLYTQNESQISDEAYGVNNIGAVGGNDNKLNPLPLFDVGFAFGGSGNDNFTTVEFVLKHSTTSLNLSSFFDYNAPVFMGARVKSVGLITDKNPDDSLKLKNGVTVRPIDNGTVPEPASIIAWSVVGLGFLGANWLRRRKVA